MQSRCGKSAYGRRQNSGTAEHSAASKALASEKITQFCSPNDTRSLMAVRTLRTVSTACRWWRAERVGRPGHCAGGLRLVTLATVHRQSGCAVCWLPACSPPVPCTDLGMRPGPVGRRLLGGRHALLVQPQRHRHLHVGFGTDREAQVEVADAAAQRAALQEEAGECAG